MASSPNEEAFIAPSTTVGGTPQPGGNAMNVSDAVSSQARRSFDMAVQNALQFSDRRAAYAVDMAFRAYAGNNYEQFRSTALAQGIQQAAGYLFNGPMAGMFGGSNLGMYSGVASSVGSGANSIGTRDRYGNESLGRITSRDFATAEMSRLMYNSVNDRYFNAAGMANSRAMGFNRDDIGDLARVMRPSFGMAAMGDMVQGADGKVTATLRPEFEKMYHASMQAGLTNASILRDTFGNRSQEEYARMGRMITGLDIAAPGGAQRMTGRLRELTAMADANGEDRGSVMQLAAANKIYGQKAYGWGEGFAGTAAHSVTSNTMMAMPELMQAQAEAVKGGRYVAHVSREEMSSMKETAIGELQKEDGGLVEAALHAVASSPTMAAGDRERLLAGVREIGTGSKMEQGNAIARLQSTFTGVIGTSASNYTAAMGGQTALNEALASNSTYGAMAVSTRFKQDNALIGDTVNQKMAMLNQNGQPQFFKDTMSAMVSKLDLGTQQQVMGVLGDNSMSGAQKKAALYAAGGNGGPATGILAGKLMSSGAEAQIGGGLGQIIDAGLEGQAMRLGTAWAADPTVKGAMTEEGRIRAESARAEIRGRTIKAGEEAYKGGGIEGLINGFMGQGPVNKDQALSYAVARENNGEKIAGLYSGEDNADGGVSMSTDALEKMKAANPDLVANVMATVGAKDVSQLRDKIATKDGATAFNRAWDESGGVTETVNGKRRYLDAAGSEAGMNALQEKNNANIINDFKNTVGGTGTEKIGDLSTAKVNQFAGKMSEALIAGGGTAQTDQQRHDLVALGRSGNADALPALMKARDDVAAKEKTETDSTKKKQLQDQLQNLGEDIQAVGGDQQTNLMSQILTLIRTIADRTPVPHP